MDDLLLKHKTIKRKLEGLEYNIFTYEARCEKARINKNYYIHCTRRYEENLKELKKENIIVNMQEYNKIKKEYKTSKESMVRFSREHERLSDSLNKMNIQFDELKKQYSDINEIIDGRKVILLFRRRDGTKI